MRCDCFYLGGHRLVSVGYSVVPNARAAMKDKGKAMRYLCILTFILLTWRIWWAPNNVSTLQMGFNLVFKELMHYPFILLSVLKETLNDGPRDWENNSGSSYCDALGDAIVIIVIISIITITIISHGIQSIQACSLFMYFGRPSFPWSSYISFTSWNLFIHYLWKACIVHS